MDCEKKIKELMEKMTLEEKIGQLQQCGPSLVGAFAVSFEELLNMMFDGKISKEEFDRLMSTAEQDFHEEELRAGHIGSYNGVGDAATANRLQKIAVEETRLGIPLLFGYDVIHGFRTVTPIPLAESCAWDRQLWEKTARIAATEATAAGIHMTFAPMVDVAKDARWGRVSEGAGEDVYLTACYGAAKVRGFQSEDVSRIDGMAACVKHFAGYGAVEAGKDYNRVDMSVQKLFEEYLPSYEACVQAGAKAVMPAFNDINGVPCSINKWLLTDVLRNQWGFNGMTISDANAIAECVEHGIAEDKADAARQAILAGMDMDMTSDSYIENLAELVKSGAVEESYIDRAVADVLRVKLELGLFEQPYQTSEERERRELLRPEYRTVAREAAEKSMVLLKNNGVLPLKPGLTIGIVGALAKSRDEMLGAWAIGARGEDCVSITDALERQGISYAYCEDKEAVCRLAEDVDILLFAAGEKKDESGEAASRANITISKEQIELLQVLKETGKPVITVLFNGRPLAIPEVDELSDAVLEAWHPGIEAGNAILNILTGKINPSAKLTTTFPYTTGQCPMYYAHINTGRPGGKGKFTSKYLDTPLTPVYPFGYGLSYTTYEYSNMEVHADAERDRLIAATDVANTGERDGEEIVQCYVRDIVGQRVRPVKKLVAFKKLFIPAGSTQRVTFEIPFEKLGYYDMQMNFVIEDGEFEVFVGTNSYEILSERITLKF